MVNCSSRRTQGGEKESWISSDAASPYQILGVDPSCSPAQLKAAFRARVLANLPRGLALPLWLALLLFFFVCVCMLFWNSPVVFVN